MLVERFGKIHLDKVLKNADDFFPFPKFGDRQGWARVAPETMQVWLKAAEQYADYPWPALPAGLCMHFMRTGENLPYMFKMFERRSVLGILALAECMEGGGRFFDQIITGVYCVCEETVWMTPFDLNPFKQNLPAPEDRIVNLASSETGALLACLLFLFRDQFDAVSPRIAERIEREIMVRLIGPYLEHDDYWWMGFVPTPRINNWNPWCNRNILMCTLLQGIDMETRVAVIHKVMRSLDSYIAHYPKDGCCDEGPMYWGAAGGGLHTCLSLLKMASGGLIDIFDETIVQDIGRYIYKAHIHDDWFVNFADGDAHVNLGAEVYQYGLDIGDEALSMLGAAANPLRPRVFNWFGAYEYMLNIFLEEEMAKVQSSAPYVRDAWMEHTEVMTARENAGSPAGLFLAVKAGHNAESHSHNDVGNFIVFADGYPLFVDLGTEEYTAKTFSPQRFEIWYLQSQYHNCPTVHGVQQHDGPRYRASDVIYDADEAHAALCADLAGAYPGEAGIIHWVRTCRLNRGAASYVSVTDEYKLREAEGNVEWNLMTPCAPEESSPGSIALEYAPGMFADFMYDAESLDVKVERIDCMESRLRRNWGDVMYRIVLSEKTPAAEASRTFTVEKRLAR